ncbi:uncharacterized protein LOC107022478 [Solanum pennellii]|uniref:Uncharacterized protein LOC107022478 n=1 Tax=Solanum pennellii TaxID=28526 RepID=A0ABM1H0A0_SOLPN|nr:uncharacterized protein LOC107022478 [Solanum pennellii]
MKMALRVSVIVSNVTLLFLLYLLIYSSILVRRMMRLRETRENFDSYLNETHLDRIFVKSLQEKTEYKAPLRNSNNGGTEMLESRNQSQFNLVFLASANPYQPANGTTFEARRKSNLDVRLNYTPVHLIYRAYADVDVDKVRRRRFMRGISIVNWSLVLITFILIVLLACFLFNYIC